MAIIDVNAAGLFEVGTCFTEQPTIEEMRAALRSLGSRNDAASALRADGSHGTRQPQRSTHQALQHGGEGETDPDADPLPTDIANMPNGQSLTRTRWGRARGRKFTRHRVRAASRFIRDLLEWKVTMRILHLFFGHDVAEDADRVAPYYICRSRRHTIHVRDFVCAFRLSLHLDLTVLTVSGFVIPIFADKFAISRIRTPRERATCAPTFFHRRIGTLTEKIRLRPLSGCRAFSRTETRWPAARSLPIMAAFHSGIIVGDLTRCPAGRLQQTTSPRLSFGLSTSGNGGG